MRRHWLWVATVSLLLAGCHTEALYNGTYPSTPTRWPDNVETCGITVSVFPMWHKAITWTKYPFVDGYQNIGGGGCSGRAHNEWVVEMEPQQTLSMGQMGMDHGSGGWNDYAVFYGFHMGPANDFQSDDLNWRVDPRYRYAQPANVNTPPEWRLNLPIGKPQTVMVHGLKWQHTLFYTFYSYYPDASKPGIPIAALFGYSVQPYPVIQTKHPRALLFVGEVYTLQIDKGHQMRIWAQYNRPVVQDAHWLEVRRAMLRKLVNAVTVRSLTPSQTTRLRTLAAVQQSCYAGSVEACRKGGLRTEYATQ